MFDRSRGAAWSSGGGRRVRGADVGEVVFVRAGSSTMVLFWRMFLSVVLFVRVCLRKCKSELRFLCRCTSCTSSAPDVASASSELSLKSLCHVGCFFATPGLGAGWTGCGGTGAESVRSDLDFNGISAGGVCSGGLCTGVCTPSSLLLEFGEWKSSLDVPCISLCLNSCNTAIVLSLPPSAASTRYVKSVIAWSSSKAAFLSFSNRLACSCMVTC